MMQLFPSLGMFRALALNADETYTLPELRHQHNLANILSLLDVAVRLSDLIEWKRAIDMRLNPTFIDPAHDLACPTCDLLAFVPHVSEIQAEHASITIHQRQWMEPRSLRQRFQGAQLSSYARGRRCGHAKHSHATRRA